MIPVSLNLINKKVVIIGGGLVAYRKVKQYLSSQAKITVVALSFIKEFKDLKINMIHDCFKEEYIDDAFMVYVCTNDINLNETIVAYCNLKGILCGCATKSDQASFYSMAYLNNDLALIALSMKQQLPSCQPLLKQMEQVLLDNQQRIMMMEFIRQYLKKHHLLSRDYMQKLNYQNDEILRFIYYSLINKTGTIFVYHQNIYQNLVKLDINNSITVTINDFKQLLDILIFPVKYQVMPLVFGYGFIYQRIFKMLPANMQMLPPLVNSEDDLKQLHQFYTNDHNQIIYLLHPKTNEQLKNSFRTLLKDNEEIYDLNEHVKLTINNNYQIVFLLLTKGQHYQEWIDKFNQYLRLGFKIKYLEPLLYQDKIITLIKQRIHLYQRH